MRCKLCGESRKLVEAHVLPRSFFRIDPTEKQPSRLVTNVAGRFARKLPKGPYDPSIVCEECERRFSPWDDYAAELFIQRWDDFERLQHSGQLVGFRLASFDYSRLKLFFLSVLWRASVSLHEMFYAVNIGPHEHKLREAILHARPGRSDEYSVVLQAFDSTNVGILNPMPERFDAVRHYRFYLGQMIAFIKVDLRPAPSFLDPLILKPDHPLLVAVKTFRDSPEREIMRRLVVKDMPKRTN